MKLPRWLTAIIGAGAFGAASGAPPANAESPEHAVIVHFQYGSTDLSRLFALEEKLEAAITAAGVGEYDGNEVAVSGADGYLYMYGPNADQLFKVVRPILQATDFMSAAEVRLRYGPPSDASEERVIIIAP